MIKEFRTVLPLIAAVATALSAYWLLRGALGVAPNDIFNGGVIGAAFVGAAYFGARRSA
ncbi:MAG TPA: hypothetical protein VFB45_27775 [Pseudolabrys sp.]|nr:hypothetical protein [Pseudolabrys sp.]